MGRYDNKEMIPLNPLLLFDNEIFTNITDALVPGVCDWYMISTYGRVYHKYLGTMMKYGLMTSGYLFIILQLKNGGHKQISIHRLEMMAFNYIPGCEKLQVNHIDGIKTHNWIWNLEWVTRSQNIQHAYNTGLHHIGEDNVHATITEDEAKSVVFLLSIGLYDFKTISEVTGVSVPIIASIKKKESWKHLTSDIEFKSRPGKLFTEQDIRNFCAYFESHPIGNKTVNDHCRDACMYLGYSGSDREIDSLRKLYNRKYYTNISSQYNF